MFPGDISEREHILFAVEGSGRVSRVADEDRFRAWGHEFLELFDRRDFEAALYVGVDGFENDAVLETERVVVRVERLDHNEFVTLVTGYLKRKVDRLASGHSDDDLRDRDFYADATVIFLRQPLAQFRQPGRVGVGNVVECVASHRLKGAFRGFDVRSADIEVIDFDAVVLGRVREWDKFPDSGGRHLAGFV